ncbi:hypothetical protein ACHAXA_003568 [Cyclostephanos tholiformis]|uniref:Uncharacterized protein n=1 Tax=Cyclostephanos tholiformis TaxID=382380 RepID=A0ABD3RTR5_9STRA
MNYDKSTRKRIRIGVNQILIASFALTSIAALSSIGNLSTSGRISSSSRPSRRRDDVGRGGAEINNEPDGSSFAGENSFHFIVSSDCTSYQRWETLTQLHSAQSVRQCGRFTWIVSGWYWIRLAGANYIVLLILSWMRNMPRGISLEEDSSQTGRGRGGANSDILTHSSLVEVVERHFPHLTISNHTIANGMGRGASVARARDDDCITLHPHVHFTPDYSDMSAYGGPYADGKNKRTYLNRHGKVVRGTYGNTYKFNNKPNGLRHWIESFLEHDDRRDEAIVLIDPDFLFLNTFQFPENTPPVIPGKPAGAKYGLGGQYLEFNLTRICERAPIRKSSLESRVCPFTSTTNSEVNSYYSTGPPYIIHIQDVFALSRRWSELVPPTYDEYPELYAEMFAYSMAAADLGLKHNLIKGLYAGCMTSWPHTDGYGELEALKTSATQYASLIESPQNIGEQRNRGAHSCFLPPLSPPPFLHYCARYSFATPYPEVEGRDVTPIYHFFAKRRVNHTVLDCGKDDQQFEPFVSSKVEKVEGGQQDWNVLAVCSVTRAINYARRKGCEKHVK